LFQLKTTIIGFSFEALSRRRENPDHIAVVILRKEDAMRTIKKEINEKNIGRVRTGMTGAFVELKKEREGFFVKFFSCKGEYKKSFKVEEGAEYVIGPDWIKKISPLDQDKYWPRRWAREYGRESQKAHLSYFRILDDGDSYGVGLYRKDGEEYKASCPKTLERLDIRPLGNFPYIKCIVRKSWLEKVSYEEFCDAMRDESLKRRWGG